MPKHLHKNSRSTSSSKRRKHNTLRHKRSSSNRRKHNTLRHKRTYSGKKIRGGGFIDAIVPNDILNVFRSVPAGLTNMYDNAIGRPTSNSNYVFPTQQKSAILDLQKIDEIRQPDILASYNKFK